MAHLGPVLVGVDGSRASSAAIRFAGHEAHRLDTGLRLVHVVPTNTPITPWFPLMTLDLEETGREILGAATDEAHRILPPGRVEAQLMRGTRVSALQHASERARLVVLGTGQRPLVERILTGSTLDGVATGATCPVVAVPCGWSPNNPHRRVAAGVKSLQQSGELLRRVFEVAADREAHVVLVHAWELPGEYDDLVTARVDEDEWADRATRAVEGCLTELRATYPQVLVETRIAHGQPARVLQAATDDADLLLVARRHNGLPFGHLGGTGRALLRVGHCPIEVVPPAEAAADTAGLLLESAGLFQK